MTTYKCWLTDNDANIVASASNKLRELVSRGVLKGDDANFAQAIASSADSVVNKIKSGV